jgi:hypothetical protein
MLRPTKFRSFEIIILWVSACVLFVSSVAGALLALEQRRWQLGLASAGILLLTAVYVWAAIRGKPQ